jgi:hypothetical protein
MKRILSVLCIAAALGLALAGCGGESGGDSGGYNPPALTPASFAGTWFGEGNDLTSAMYTYQIDVDDTGNITAFYQNGTDIGVTGTIAADPASGTLFTIALSDGTLGFIMSDGTVTHLTYVDDYGTFCVLQKGAAAPLPVYAVEDVYGIWMGYSIETDVNFTPVTVGSSSVEVASDYTLSGIGLGGTFTGSIYDYLTPDFGLFAATSNTDSMVIHLSPDKTVAGAMVCGDSGFVTFPACTFSIWAK